MQLSYSQRYGSYHEAVEMSSSPDHVLAKLLIVNLEGDQQLERSLNRLQTGVCEDLTDLLNVSKELEAIPFTVCKKLI